MKKEIWTNVICGIICIGTVIAIVLFAIAISKKIPETCHDLTIDGVTYCNVSNINVHPEHNKITFKQNETTYTIQYTSFTKTSHKVKRGDTQ